MHELNLVLYTHHLPNYQSRTCFIDVNELNQLETFNCESNPQKEHIEKDIENYNQMRE